MVRLQQVSHPPPLSSCSTEIELVTNTQGDHQTSVQNGCSQINELRASSDEQILLLDDCREPKAAREEADEECWLPRFLVFSLNFACVSLMVASPSYMDSESSRRSSTSWTSKLSSSSSTAEANSSISRTKVAVKSDASSHESSSSKFGPSSASCASVSWAVYNAPSAIRLSHQRLRDLSFFRRM